MRWCTFLSTNVIGREVALNGILFNRLVQATALALLGWCLGKRKVLGLAQKRLKRHDADAAGLTLSLMSFKRYPKKFAGDAVVDETPQSVMSCCRHRDLVWCHSDVTVRQGALVDMLRCRSRDSTLSLRAPWGKLGSQRVYQRWERLAQPITTC